MNFCALEMIPEDVVHSVLGNVPLDTDTLSSFQLSTGLGYEVVEFA